MKAAIRKRLNGEVPPPPAPLLMSDPFLQHCAAQVAEGKFITFEQAAGRLGVGYDCGRKIFRGEPGVLKVRSVYRIPECVYERVLARLMTRC